MYGAKSLIVRGAKYILRGGIMRATVAKKIRKQTERDMPKSEPKDIRKQYRKNKRLYNKRLYLSGNSGILRTVRNNGRP